MDPMYLPDVEEHQDSGLIDKVNRESMEIRREDLDRARAAGWTDEALYDAITVCGLFNFYNVWIDATGVHDMPAEGLPGVGKEARDRRLFALMVGFAGDR